MASLSICEVRHVVVSPLSGEVVLEMWNETFLDSHSSEVIGAGLEPKCRNVFLSSIIVVHDKVLASCSIVVVSMYEILEVCVASKMTDKGLPFFVSVQVQCDSTGYTVGKVIGRSIAVIKQSKRGLAYIVE